MNKSAHERFSVLIVDDDESFRQSLVLNLGLKDFLCREARSAADATQAIERERFDFILLDLRLPGAEGVSLVTELSTLTPNSRVIVMSGFGGPEIGLEVVRKGAYDFIEKPFPPESLVYLLEKTVARESLSPVRKSSEADPFQNLIGSGEAMTELLSTVRRLSPYTTTVLLRGESGTGKELLARALHASSPRSEKPFVAINCGAIPEHLMESELFGHRKGAFTDATRDKVGLFQEASHGTLFLDEVGELPTHLQVKLLRALQEQQIQRVGDEQPIAIDVRIVAATHRDLDKDVLSGRFREDLLYRLNVVSIVVPPLRERREDIPELVKFFQGELEKKLGLPEKEFTPEAMDVLMNYRWRGNVRELENAVERATVLSDGEKLEKDDLPPTLLGSKKGKGGGGFVISGDNLSVKKHSRDLEVELITKALTRTKGNRTQAAKLLDLSHRALLYKIKEYEIG